MHEGNTKKVIFEKYCIEKTIGSGAFAKVKLAKHIRTHESVAIKIFKKSKLQPDDFVRIHKEIELTKKLNHPNIIKVYEILEDDLKYYIVMEYVEGGELFYYILKKKRLADSESSSFFYQTINGLEYLHRNNVVHRDLKPENILLTKDKFIKIIDFGLSTFFKQDLLATPCGSPCYASPEMVQGKNYNGEKIDLWSLGVTLFAMCCGYLPFEDKNNSNLFKKIIVNKIEYPKYIQFIYKDMIKKLLTSDPNNRIEIKDIKKHQLYINGKNNFIKEFKDFEKIINEEGEINSDIKRMVKSEVIRKIENYSFNNTMCTLSDDAVVHDIMFNKLIRDKEFINKIINTEIKDSSSVRIKSEGNSKPSYNPKLESLTPRIKYRKKESSSLSKSYQKCETNPARNLFTDRNKIKLSLDLNPKINKKINDSYTLNISEKKDIRERILCTQDRVIEINLVDDVEEEKNKSVKKYTEYYNNMKKKNECKLNFCTLNSIFSKRNELKNNTNVKDFKKINTYAQIQLKKMSLVTKK